jgi:hypothetical protein
MPDIHISSEKGLQWGNVVITPEELSEWIDGISLLDGQLVLNNVKVINWTNNECFIDAKGETILLSDLRDLLYYDE